MILQVFPHWLHIDCSQALSHSLGCVLRSTGEQLTHVWLSSDENRHVIALFFFAAGIGWSQRRYTSFPRLSGSLSSSPPLLTPLNKTVSSDESDDTELFEPVNGQVQFLCSPPSLPLFYPAILFLSFRSLLPSTPSLVTYVHSIYSVLPILCSHSILPRPPQSPLSVIAPRVSFLSLPPCFPPSSPLTLPSSPLHGHHYDSFRTALVW